MHQPPASPPPALPPGPEQPWWADTARLGRVVTDLVMAELRRLRPGAALPPLAEWTADLEIGPDGLGADSLELLQLATALTEFLHLHRSGIEDYLLARRRLGDWVAIAAAALGRFDAEVTFRTSGSTGTPKPCPHRLDRLVEEVEEVAALLGPVTGIAALVPSHHIYGFLFTVLLPWRLGMPTQDMRGRMPSRVAAELGPGGLLVAVPEQWATIARSGVALPAAGTGLCSTAPLPAGIADVLAAQGLGRLVELYGSSETAGIGWRDRQDAPFRLLPRWRFDEEGATLIHRGGGRTARLPDRLELVDADSFHVAGRRDQAVQIGGVNVFPAAVTLRLEGHPLVAAAAVRPFTAGGGLRLKAFIVPADRGADQADLVAALDRWSVETLRPEERPRSWTVGPSLPRDPLGKAVDWVPAPSDRFVEVA